MNRAVLQVPLDISLRNAATRVAAQEGFSSLQEAVRLFLTKFANKSITVTLGNDEELSPKAARRYARMIADIKKGRNITSTKNLDELFSYLNEG